MCEVTVGVYTSPRMTKPVRDRVWAVVDEWFQATATSDMAVVMTWPDLKAPGGQVFRTLGLPKVDLREHDGMVLVRCALTAETRRSLTIHAERNRGRST